MHWNTTEKPSDEALPVIMLDSFFFIQIDVSSISAESGSWKLVKQSM